MEIRIVSDITDDLARTFRIGIFDENDVQQSLGTFRYRNTSFHDGYVKTLTAGGVATPVHFRRGGNVKKLFDYVHQKAFEEGAVIGLLHPFSFAYYNKFEYEKVSDHLILSCPIRYIDFVPRRCSLVPYTPDMLNDLVKLYREFSRGRSLLFERKLASQFQTTPKNNVYVYYKDGKPEGYITYTLEKELYINNYRNSIMKIAEMVYTSPEALRELFSFIRMYEGEYDDVEFQNLAPTPEVDILLRNYTHTSYKLLPDVAARIISTERALNAMTFPNADGRLTISIPEGDVGVKGTYMIEWGGNSKRITRLSDGYDADATLTTTALARLVYGYDMVNAITLPYISGVTVHKNTDAFISAFPKRNTGVFEHF